MAPGLNTTGIATATNHCLTVDDLLEGSFVRLRRNQRDSHNRSAAP
jgi:hypothetical protein